MTTIFKNFFKGGVLVAGLFLATSFVTAADAATTNACDISTAGRVTPNIGCEFLTGISSGNSNTESNVNAAMMFGIGDWELLGKVDPVPGSNGGLTLVGTDKAGAWSISSAIFDVYTDVMISFKSGTFNNTDPSSVVAYLVNVASGSYNSPFEATTGSAGYRGISNVALFVSGVNPGCDPITQICDPGVSEVPLPAGLPLLLAALGGIGILSRRKHNI